MDAITEIQAKRFQHNAKLLVAPIYFKDRSRFEATLTRYFSTSSLYAADITAIGRASRAAPDDVTRLRQAADEHQMQMNQLYDDLEQQTKEQLGELEDERDSFW